MLNFFIKPTDYLIVMLFAVIMGSIPNSLGAMEPSEAVFHLSEESWDLLKKIQGYRNRLVALSVAPTIEIKKFLKKCSPGKNPGIGGPSRPNVGQAPVHLEKIKTLLQEVSNAEKFIREFQQNSFQNEELTSFQTYVEGLKKEGTTYKSSLEQIIPQSPKPSMSIPSPATELWGVDYRLIMAAFIGAAGGAKLADSKWGRTAYEYGVAQEKKRVAEEGADPQSYRVRYLPQIYRAGVVLGGGIMGIMSLYGALLILSSVLI